MKGKTLLAASCILSIAVGYIAGKMGGNPAANIEEGSSTTSDRKRNSPPERRNRLQGDGSMLESILAGRPIGEIPHGELAALIARLSKYEPGMDPVTRSRQAYQLQLLLAKLSPAQLDQIATSVHTDQNPEQTASLGTLLSALAAKDPDRALAWLSSREIGDQIYSTVISVIARDDPMAAADLLREALLDGKITQNSHFTAAYGIGQAMAALGAGPLLDYLDSLPGNQQMNIANNVMRFVPEEERIRLLEDLRLRIEDGRMPEMRIDSLFTSILENDESAAKAWFSALPDSEKKVSMRTSAAMELFNRGKKDAAAEWMRDALAADPGHEKQTLQQVISNLYYRNPDGIRFFAQLLPENVDFSAEDLQSIARGSLYNGTGALTSLATAIRNPDEQAKLITSTLESVTSTRGHRLNANDFAILSRQIAAMGFTGENATRIQNAIENARNTKPDTIR